MEWVKADRGPDFSLFFRDKATDPTGSAILSTVSSRRNMRGAQQQGRIAVTASQPIAPPQPPIPEAGKPPTPAAWQAAFEQALPYAEFLATHATPDQRSRWEAFHGQIALSAEQTALLGSFVRRMPVLVLAGAWCGDCVNQCPIFTRFAEASPLIDVRFLDRDAQPEIAAHLTVCGGQRVPVALFLSEDFHPVVYHGDRTLAAYRLAVADQLGTSCPTGLVPPADEAVAAVVADWLDIFERVQLILRLSGRLRKLHGD